jgi:exopolysaccharide biosynthesis polyprenyl glycosylphosphotransferase
VGAVIGSRVGERVGAGRPFRAGGTPGVDPVEQARILDLADIADDDRALGAPVPGPATSALHHYRWIAAALVVLDAACLTGALLGARALRFGELPSVDDLWAIVVAVVLWVAVFHAFGLYSAHHIARLEEFRRVVSAVGVGIVLVILVTFWLDVYVSRSLMALTLVLALALELTARLLVRAILARLRSSDAFVLRTLVVGSPAQSFEAMEALDRPGSGFLPLGYVDAGRSPVASGRLSPLDRVDRLRRMIRWHQADCVLIASSTIGTSEMAVVLQAARRERVLIRVHTHLSGVLASRLLAQPMAGEGVMLSVKPAGLSPAQRVIKRALDVSVGSLALLVTAPILGAAAAAIRLTSAGPVLFRQERVTEAGRVFVMFKFRTMTDDADRVVAEQGLDTSVPFFKLKSDPRLTPVGRRLRRWSIDELPQLLNVLRGDMSIVGPRPLPVEQVTANLELLAPRHEVRAGMTGWWQIQGRSELDVDDALRMDLFYIENWSLALEAYVILRTAGALFRKRGAY